MDQTTRDLAERVAAIRFETLSETVIHETKRRMLDSVACAAGAFDYPLSAKMREFADRQRTTAPARVWFTGAPSTTDLAGLANGTMVRYLDLSDTILSKAAGHPSDMIPALVALAEATGASGKTLIAAIVAAYEVYGGLCDAVALQKSAVDQSTGAALGAAAGASRILNLDAEPTGHALALALTANVSLYNVRQGALSDWKALAGPNGARNGVFAAELAATGLTGPSGVFDGPTGFKDIVGAFDFAQSGDGPQRLLNTHLKAYPVCYHGQSAVDAAMSLAGKTEPEDIRAVTVETYETAFRMMGNDPSRWAPPNRETADHSIPFVVGTVLTTGNLRADDYRAERLSDRGLLAFLKKIEVKPSEAFSAQYPKEARSKITVETMDGTVIHAETIQPTGHAENPMSDDALMRKLNTLWPASLGDNAAQVAETIWRLDDLQQVGELVDALCVKA